MTDAARAHAHRRKVWRFGRIFIPVWIGLAVVATLLIAADAKWHFGWGSRWQDVLLGMGMVAFGFLFWVTWNLMFKLLGWLTDIFIRSEPTG